MADPAFHETLIIQLEADADAARAVQQTVYRGLVAFNREQAGAPDEQVLTLSVRDADGAVIAGLVGATAWRWLVIPLLWVDPAHRHRGLGRALLRRAEDEARSRGCVGATLDTYDFQAPDFYEREGYSVVGVVEGFPPGHRRFTLKKDLTTSADG